MLASQSASHNMGRVRGVILVKCQSHDFSGLAIRVDGRIQMPGFRFRSGCD